MKRTMAILLVAAAACGAFFSIQATQADEPPAGFTKLFDGKSLEGWALKTEQQNGEPASSQWTAEGGVLKAIPSAGWLSTKKMYKDFTLMLEWRVPENGNSGVFVLVPDLKKGEHPHEKGIEVQVLDDRGPEYAGKLKDYQYAGSIYAAVAAKDAPYKGAGEWNAFEITCQGGRLSVKFNGQQVSEATIADEPALAGRPAEGYIGLQNHGTGVEYRNIYIKELGDR